VTSPPWDTAELLGSRAPAFGSPATYELLPAELAKAFLPQPARAVWLLLLHWPLQPGFVLLGLGSAGKGPVS